MKPISKMDWDIINARVSNICERHKFSKKTIGFLAIVVSQIFPGNDENLQEIIIDGPNDKGIDAIHIIEAETSAEIFFISVKIQRVSLLVQ